MEDIRIGKSIWFRITAVPAGSTVSLAGNGSRIGVKLLFQSFDSVGAGRLFAFLSNGGLTTCFMYANASQPTDEVTLERHGQLVYQPMSITAVTANGSILETFLDNQQDAPPPPKFPATGISGPIPASFAR